MSGFVTFENVTKRFGEATVLRDFNFTMERGERVSLIGPSGSGKSTLLRVLMTLESIDHGRVTMDGQTIWHVENGRHILPASEARLRGIRDRVGMVFQQFNLFPHMTALENVAAGPRHIRKKSRPEAARIATAMLNRVGLGDKVANYPAGLSGGQQQRVALARALTLEPDLMLLDEVTSALDPEVVGEVLEVMRDLIAERRLSTLLVTHQMAVARAMSDRICFFEKGRVVEEGSPAELLDRPRNPRTAAFLAAVSLERFSQ